MAHYMENKTLKTTIPKIFKSQDKKFINLRMG